MPTIDFPIKNRWTGEIQFTAKIDASEDTPLGVKIGLAVKWAIGARANLSGAYLSGADLSGAYLSGADLSRAYLSDANLSRAYLSDANLSGADLSRAYLSDANLSGAYLSGANLSGADLSPEALRPFKADMWLTLTQAEDHNEVRFLIAALRHGAVDGGTYGDGKKCACLVGTLARFKGEEGEARDHGSSRPAERWFLMITPGDTPGKVDADGKETGGGFAARMALAWAEKWCAAVGVDPEFPNDPAIQIPALEALASQNKQESGE